ncbi:hypothetical protein KTH_36780 [Thermosporothrix hazakensis]|nr:hypothetical protein KTH_36780 [Thermosporothrix hazakensis]
MILGNINGVEFVQCQFEGMRGGRGCVVLIVNRHVCTSFKRDARGRSGLFCLFRPFRSLTLKGRECQACPAHTRGATLLVFLVLLGREDVERPLFMVDCCTGTTRLTYLPVYGFLR